MRESGESLQFSDIDVAVLRAESIPDSLLDGVLDELSKSGARVVSDPRPSGPYASLEWVIPTAVTVFIAHRYLGTLLEEAAKDHYIVLKSALRRLVTRTTGSDREIRVHIISSSPAKARPTDDAAVFSIWSQLRDDRRVKFVFEHEIVGDHVPAALDAMFALLHEHCAGRADDELSLSPSAFPGSSWSPVLMRYNTTIGKWEPWIYRKGDLARALGPS